MGNTPYNDESYAIKADIACCARCGKAHKQLSFTRLRNTQPESSKYTHRALCPETGLSTYATVYQEDTDSATDRTWKHGNSTLQDTSRQHQAMQRQEQRQYDNQHRTGFGHHQHRSRGRVSWSSRKPEHARYRGEAEFA